MNCPNCGTPEHTRARKCPDCGAAYASADLLELRQLEFLLAETADWHEAAERRLAYLDRLEFVRGRILLPGAVESLASAEPAVERPAPAPEPTPIAPPSSFPLPIPQPAPVQPLGQPAAPPQPLIVIQPKPAPVSFEQWLLSERNIKIALYSGSVLLVLAGFIFVGVNWVRIPGPTKFALTLMLTGLMYLSGWLLFQRPAYKLGGVALLGIGSGFIPVNILVLHIYIFAERGVSANIMWLLGSLPALLLYALTSYWTRAGLFTYMTLAALASLLTASLVLNSTPQEAFPLAYTLLALALLSAAYGMRAAGRLEYASRPFMIVSQVSMGLLQATWVLPLTASHAGCVHCDPHSFWLYGSALGMGIFYYLLTDLLYRLPALRWASSGLFAVLFYLALLQLAVPETGLIAAMSMLALVYLLPGWLDRQAARKVSTWTPLETYAQFIMPVVSLYSLYAWAEGNPWAVVGLLLGAAFYIALEILQHKRWARWVSAPLLVLALLLGLVSLELSTILTTALLMVLALLYLLTGWQLEHVEPARQTLPVYLSGAALALFVTAQALMVLAEYPFDAALVLLADVILLAVMARIRTDYRWVYGAAWLFTAPTYLLVGVYGGSVVEQGLASGLLMLNYSLVGYMLGRRELRWGGPFLSAATFLSVLAAALTWEKPLAAVLVLASAGLLYFFAAAWQRMAWLLLPALLAAHLLVTAVLRQIIQPGSPWLEFYILVYAVIAFALALGAARLRQTNLERWGWPLYLFAAAGLAATYFGAAALAGWLPVGLSAAYAALAFSLAWLERKAMIKYRLPPWLSYAGAGLAFAAVLFGLGQIRALHPYWPPSAAAAAALMVVLSWLLRRGDLAVVFGRPLRWSGFVLVVIPLVGGVTWSAGAAAGAFSIAGAVLAGDAVVHKSVRTGYLAVAALIAASWGLLGLWQVSELQAYAIPPGLALLVSGWSERRFFNSSHCLLPTVAGLAVLLGSAFYQSLESPGHAGLLLLESLAAFGWGIYTHSRSYVQAGVLALIANAFIQLGPAFLELARWIQVGVIGTLLLGFGLFGLFQRDKIIQARKRLSDEWRQWET